MMRAHGGRRRAHVHAIAEPHASPGHRERERYRDPERAGAQKAGQRESHDAEPDVQNDHLGDGRALGRRCRDAAGDVGDVGRAAHAEQGADHAAREAGRGRPPAAHSMRGLATKHHVQGVDAHEHAQREQGDVARQADEQRHPQREADERERDEHEQLSRVRLPARMESQREPRAEVEERGQRKHEGDRKDMDEHRDRDRRGAESRDAEYQVSGKDHERHHDQRFRRD